MRTNQIIIALIITCVCVNFEVKAQFSPDLIKTAIKQQLDRYVKDENMQLKFVQGFIQGMILGEIRLYNLALNHEKQIGSDDAKKVKEEMNGFISTLFDGQFKSLEELVKQIKTEKNDLNGLFSPESFQQDIKNMRNQEKLAHAVMSYLYSQHPTTNIQENLTKSYQFLDKLRRFMVDYKGAKDEDIEKAYAYLKDPKLVKATLSNVIDKLADPKTSGPVIKLLSKLKNVDMNSFDIVRLIQDDPEMVKLLADQNWEDLLKLREYMTKSGGKIYDEYYKNNKPGNEDEDDEDEDDDEDDESQSSSSKTVWIIFGVFAVAVIAYCAFRKYRQSKYDDGTYSENKKLYKASNGTD